MKLGQMLSEESLIELLQPQYITFNAKIESISYNSILNSFVVNVDVEVPNAKTDK